MNSYNWTCQMVVCNEPSGKELLGNVWKKGTHHERRKLAPQTFTKASVKKHVSPSRKAFSVVLSVRYTLQS